MEKTRPPENAKLELFFSIVSTKDSTKSEYCGKKLCPANYYLYRILVRFMKIIKAYPMKKQLHFWAKASIFSFLTCFLTFYNTANSQTTVNFSVAQPTPMVVKFEVDYKPDRLTFVFWDSTTTNPVDWYWDFGDGVDTMVQNTSHIYAAKGIYNVCLSVKNSDNCRDTTCVEINSFLGIDNFSQVEHSVRLSPNPFTSELNIQFELFEASNVNVKLYNLLGDEVSILTQGYLSAGTVSLGLNERDNAKLDAGIYFLRFDINGSSFTKKVIRN